MRTTSVKKADKKEGRQEVILNVLQNNLDMSLILQVHIMIDWHRVSSMSF